MRDKFRQLRREKQMSFKNDPQIKVLGSEIEYLKTERGCSDLQPAKKRRKTTACRVACGVHALKE